MSAYLAIISGLPAKVFPLVEGTWIVGRATTADIELNHVEISRQHCRFAWDGAACTVEDLGSVRGTRVNETRIKERTTLRPGDRVGVGPAVLEFGLGDAPRLDSAERPKPSEEATQMLVQGRKSDRIEVDRELFIGREPDLDIWLNNPAVSRANRLLA